MRTGLMGISPLLTGLLWSTMAGAAEPKAPPLQKTEQPVMTCPEYGAGFFRLPGQDICLKTSIDLSVEMKVDAATQDIYIETARVAGNPLAFYDRVKFDRTMDRTQSRVDPRLNFMAVSRIGDDPVVTFASFRTGQTLTAATARSSVAERSDSLWVDQAWVKYKGVTAGRHASFFDFTPGYTYSGGYASQHNLNLFSYTHTFGKVATLSLSVEDALERRVEDSVWAAYGGQRMPDLVVQARYLPTWGIVHAAAALHEIIDSVGNRSTMAYAANAGVEYRQKWAEVFGASAADTYGRFLLNGAYTNGALSYLGIPKFGTDYVSDLDNRIVKTRAYSGVISYEHVWKPNFKTTASYSLYALRSDMTNFDFKVRGSLAQIGAEYMPVPGLMVGAELNYFRDQVRGVYFGVPATRDRVDIFTGYAYIRRRI